jgi:hypothetical protein
VGAAGDGKPAGQWTSPDFTSWGTVKSHHYCGGIYGLAFSPDAESVLCCGMGFMADPMSGNGKMTWQRWAWQKGEKLGQIKDDQRGAGLMESIVMASGRQSFHHGGRQVQGTWNAAIFSAADGALVHSIDTKKRITRRDSAPTERCWSSRARVGQPQRKGNVWPEWGKVQVFSVES